MIELNDDTRWILGRPNFQCGAMARDLRAIGHEINCKSEDEQAHVIHWLLGLYETHGADWRTKATAELRKAIKQNG